MTVRCGSPGVCARRRCGGVCMAVRGHIGPHGCVHACREAIAAASMLRYLTTGQYVEYQLVGEA